MSEFILQAARAEQDGAGKIRTYTGRYVDPLNMRGCDICIEDIAHHLSNECRYAGATPRHYSVAQHSVAVSQAFSYPPLMLAGLLHDAAEAYLKDIPSPVKHDSRMAWYREVDQQLTVLVFSQFGLSADALPRVKTVDDAVFDQECFDFWGPHSQSFVWKTPQEAEAEFLRQYHHCVLLIQGMPRPAFLLSPPAGDCA